MFKPKLNHATPLKAEAEGQGPRVPCVRACAESHFLNENICWGWNSISFLPRTLKGPCVFDRLLRCIIDDIMIMMVVYLVEQK